MKTQSDNVAVVLAEQPAVAGAGTGSVIGFAPSGEPVIDCPGEIAPRRLVARTCVPLRPEDVGRTAVLLFDGGDRDRPIVVGLLQSPSPRLTEIVVDGDTIVFNGRERVVLRCGEASITLNRDGKVVIRGEHVVSHAAGVNRIRGGSVQLN